MGGGEREGGRERDERGLGRSSEMLWRRGREGMELNYVREEETKMGIYDYEFHER